MYDRNILKSYETDVPVLVVGNLNLGGAGKTPFTEYLIEMLQEDYRLAVLSRGYKRKTRGFLLAKPGATWRELGDEPYQIYLKYGSRVAVAVDEDRVHGINELKRLVDPDVVILDDAFQHRRLVSGLRILLTPFDRPFTEDELFPAGNLRDLPARAKTAGLIVISKVPEEKTKQALDIKQQIEAFTNKPVFIFHMHYGKPYQNGKTLDWKDLQGKKHVLVTGIARPELLTDYLLRKNINFVPLLFPDHAEYEGRNLKKIKAVLRENQAEAVITTEKDAQKLRNCGLDPVVVPVRFHTKNEETFKQKIYEYVNSGKFI